MTTLRAHSHGGKEAPSTASTVATTVASHRQLIPSGNGARPALLIRGKVHAQAFSIKRTSSLACSRDSVAAYRLFDVLSEPTEQVLARVVDVAKNVTDGVAGEDVFELNLAAVSSRMHDIGSRKVVEVAKISW